MGEEKPQVHNRFKLPLFLVCLVCGIAMAVGGAIIGPRGFVVPGLLVVVASCPPIWVIVTGRGNPRWMRSRFDAPTDDGVSGNATPASGERVLYGFVLLGAIGFVVAGIALIAVGAARGRSEFVLVGAVSILFFGACAWIALAIVRGTVQIPRRGGS